MTVAHASQSAPAGLLKQAVSVWPGRLPRHTWALAVCGLALLLGIAVADDYEIFRDADDQREIGEATLRHLAGESGLNLLTPPTERLYGPIFETPLAVIERILGGDSRRVFLSRHLLTHLFFVAAAFAGYLLACRLFASRWLALFVLLLFLLHPRIYAHSFFNSKDVPFLAMFMICLWLAHRAFRPQDPAGIDGAAVKDGTASYGAFAICGVAAGALTNLRIAGLGLVAAVVLLRLFDFIGARGWYERRSAIVSGLLFAVAAAGTYYATMPYLWADPLERFGEIVTVMLAHPNEQPHLFQGELVLGSQLPLSYLPVWFGITTPPLALALGVVGLAALVWRCGCTAIGRGRLVSDEPRAQPAHSLALRMAALLRNTPLRFELLVGASFVLPVLAVVVLQPTLYGGWRHFYFLWAPFVLLAAAGLLTLAEGTRNACRRFLPSEMPAVAVVAVLAALGLGVIAVGMARMHPDQERYFNVLATGPDAALPLRLRYYQRVVGPYRSITYILEELAAREEPDAVFNIKAAQRRWAWRTALLSEHDRRRFMFDPARDVDFFHVRAGVAPLVTPAVLYERRLYGEVLLQVGTPDLSRVHAAVADVYRALYRDVTAGVPALSGETDVYGGETSVTWVKESCPAGGVNRAQRMIVVPLDAARAQQRLGVDGVRVGDACLWQSALPEYAVGKILFFDGIGTLVSDAWRQEIRRRHAAISAAPAARSTFDVYLEDGVLTYIKSPCVQADTDEPFFVHVSPARLGDLPNFRRRFGFDALDFRFGASKRSWRTVAGDIFDGICMATLALPDYPIANIATGQYTPGSDHLWHVDIGGG